MKDTIWQRARWPWRLGALLGLVGGLAWAVLTPYVLLSVAGQWKDVWPMSTIAYVMILGGSGGMAIVALSWLNLITSGKYAGLWNLMWIMGSMLIVVPALCMPIWTPYYADWWESAVLVLPAIQVWVGLEADFLWRENARPSDMWYTEFMRLEPGDFWIFRTLWVLFIAGLIAYSVWIYLR